MIKNIFFDLDDTIFDYYESEKIALSTALLKGGIEPTDEILKAYHTINIPLWQLYERKEAECEFIVVERFRQLFEKCGIDFDPQKMEDIYENELAHNAHLVRGAREMLEELHKNYRLYVASNGLVKIQESRLKLANIEHYFSDVFTSQRNGASKPNLEFFEYCFARIPDFKLEETIIVGDSLTSDIKGGINSGLRTVWFNKYKMKNTTDISPDFEFTTLSEVKDFIINEKTIKA